WPGENPPAKRRLCPGFGVGNRLESLRSSPSRARFRACRPCYSRQRSEPPWESARPERGEQSPESTAVRCKPASRPKEGSPAEEDRYQAACRLRPPASAEETGPVQRQSQPVG